MTDVYQLTAIYIK